MLYLICHLFFRITPSNINAIPKESFHKLIRTGNLDKCWDNLQNDRFSPQSYVDYMIYCHNQLNPPVFNMMSTNTINAHSSTPNSQVFKIRNVECSITACPITGCTFKSSLINFEGTNNNFNANSNIISKIIIMMVQDHHRQTFYMLIRKVPQSKKISLPLNPLIKHVVHFELLIEMQQL